MTDRKEQAPPIAREADVQIGQYVAELRAAAGLTQAQLADRMRALGWKWKQQTCWMIEKGRQSLRLQEANDLAHILDVRVDWLLPFGDNQDPAIASDTTGLRSDMRNLQLLADQLWRAAKAYEELRRRVCVEADTPRRQLPDTWRQDIAVHAGRTASDVVKGGVVVNHTRRRPTEVGPLTDRYFQSMETSYGQLLRSPKGD